MIFFIVFKFENKTMTVKIFFKQSCYYYDDKGSKLVMRYNNNKKNCILKLPIVLNLVR